MYLICIGLDVNYLLYFSEGLLLDNRASTLFGFLPISIIFMLTA